LISCSFADFRVRLKRSATPFVSGCATKTKVDAHEWHPLLDARARLTVDRGNPRRPAAALQLKGLPGPVEAARLISMTSGWPKVPNLPSLRNPDSHNPLPYGAGGCAKLCLWLAR
jgi:hypothetical protein